MKIDDFDSHPLTWFKSTHSGGEGGDCIEVAASPTVVHIRDSKDPSGGTLTVDHDAWAAFVTFARHL
ncbi:DUF397 domain-containing protein [Streptomyces sp. PTM05]|uniref:DUF397 domain-containing protein n=1 Tax=Streptantibioticus parmotrematis TaxID=2873249 RepID=A0ABS7R046_9ACTN|nr:DUF397 domain-containing protein [Streptantibioticus parmotrematis]MBY8888833.1 DUF397 domain-containing protein [Streptantibioticus parmotrematis]